MASWLKCQLAFYCIMTKDFYSTKRWKDKRRHILVRDGFLDKYILQMEGRHEEAKLVHHILPREQYPQYQWCDWNLISVSASTHRRLHVPLHNDLSNEGKRLAKITALANGVKLNMRTLVIGGSSSTRIAYVKKHMDGALVYDMEHIASAFRLGEDINVSARKMANALLEGFCMAVKTYSSNSFIIRACPSLKEIEMIDPDRIVVIDREGLDEITDHAKANGIEIIME